jgi:O-methyltransferase
MLAASSTFGGRPVKTIKTLATISMQVALIGFAVFGLVVLLLISSLSTNIHAARPAHTLAATTSLADHYLDTLKRHLTRSDYESSSEQHVPATIRSFARARGLKISRLEPGSEDEGTAWPETAETMIGLKRLDNLQFCIRDVIAHRISGDLIECGAWRGGATIFMRAALLAYGDTDRRVWVADSFEGLPIPDPKTFPADLGLDLYKQNDQLAIGVNTVKLNFARYGLLDERVRFLVGWFKNTLPNAPIEKLAVLRLDGDLYESTIESLAPLYDKLSPGGYVILDDYYNIAASRKAVDDYREQHHIAAEIKQIDSAGAYWQK